VSVLCFGLFVNVLFREQKTEEENFNKRSQQFPSIPESLILPQTTFLKEDWPIQDLTAADSYMYQCRIEYFCHCNVHP
jgi:hypothetical protein